MCAFQQTVFVSTVVYEQKFLEFPSQWSEIWASTFGQEAPGNIRPGWWEGGWILDVEKRVFLTQAGSEKENMDNALPGVNRGLPCVYKF